MHFFGVAIWWTSLEGAQKGIVHLSPDLNDRLLRRGMKYVALYAATRSILCIIFRSFQFIKNPLASCMVTISTSTFQHSCNTRAPHKEENRMVKIRTTVRPPSVWGGALGPRFIWFLYYNWRVRRIEPSIDRQHRNSFYLLPPGRVYECLDCVKLPTHYVRVSWMYRKQQQQKKKKKKKEVFKFGTAKRELINA